MFSRLKLALFISVLFLFALACGLGSGENAGSYQAVEEPGDYENTGNDLAEEPAEMQPTSTPPATPTMPPAMTNLPDTGGGEGPEPTPIAISMDLNSIYARVVEELPQGSALFNPPASMRVGDVKVVEVRVVPMTGEEIEQDEQIRATLTSGMEEVDEVVVIPLRVSTVMSARLSGIAFEINPLTAEEQIRISDSDYLSWMWEVNPQKSGSHQLTLHLSVVVNAEGMGEKTYTTTEVREIEVQTNPIYSLRMFFGKNWEWVVTGLLFPAVGWAWRRFRSVRG